MQHGVAAPATDRRRVRETRRRPNLLAGRLATSDIRRLALADDDEPSPNRVPPGKELLSARGGVEVPTSLTTTKFPCATAIPAAASATVDTRGKLKDDALPPEARV
jgi:hypothetical protein